MREIETGKGTSSLVPTTEKNAIRRLRDGLSRSIGEDKV